MQTRSGLAFALLLALAVSRAHSQAPPPNVWIEGEAPASANVKTEAVGWGRSEYLSGGQWLHVSVDADKVAAAVPAEGVLLSYAFTVPAAGRHEIWNRIGFEFVRSPFDWRVDGGPWESVTPDRLTTDLMEISTWCEVAWLQLGSAELTSGPHRLEIRLPRTTDEKGQPARVLYASDALCITPGPFQPNSHRKPGEEETGPDAEAAASRVFELPAPQGPAARSAVALQGLWQVCRADEQLPPADIAVPMTDLPANPHWRPIPVPSDRNVSRPDLLFAHRLWYRTRVRVPDAAAGRSFHLLFPLNNLNTTVYVNGQYCGFEKNPYARFQIDITKAVKPGINEVWVGIRDAWYGYSTNPRDPMKLRRKFNLPLEVVERGFQDLAYPIWKAFRSGILNTPEMVCAGPVKTVDAFVKTSVANKRLDAEVTLRNATPQPAAGEVVTEALDDRTGQVAQRFAAVPFALPAGGETTVNAGGAWAEPTLWWPDAPHLYRLRATVRIDGRDVDTFDQTFGFREWGARGTDFTLNGVVWPVWCDLVQGANPEEWLATYRRTNQRGMRLMGAAQGGIRWMGMTTDEALDWFDRNGVVVRRSGPLDGEAIGYHAPEHDPDLRDLYKSPIKMDLMNNWRDQMVAQVKGERNHPSIMLWSTENEWLYINCINLHGDLMDAFEAAVTACHEAVHRADPTRLTMVDGGGATKSQSLPVHGDHYVFGDQGFDKYPSLAYERNPTGGGRGRWLWDEKRPRFIGEDFFATGINPAEYSLFGGEAAFLGKTEARPAAALVYRMLTEGYRWAGQSAWQFWLGHESVAGNPWVSNSPRAVFCRQWDWTFAAGQTVPRTFGLFNSTQYAEPLVFTWSLAFGGKTVATATATHAVPPGEMRTVQAMLPMPAATVRREGKLTLTLSAGGKVVFKDSKAVSVLPAPRWRTSGVLLYDPRGDVSAYLKRRSIAFTPVKSLSALPSTGRVLVVGRDALTAAESTSSRLAAWVQPGRRVVVLEQREPLRYQGIPAEMDPSDASGQIAFLEDAGHPAAAGLQQKDLFTWGPDMRVYRAAYAKPGRGARSLIQCGIRLRSSALVEVPIGSGLLLLNQTLTAERLGTSVVAETLLRNLVDYAAGYRQQFRPVAAAVAPGTPLARTLEAIGLRHTRVPDAAAALKAAGARLAVVEATPANLRALAAVPQAVKAFTDAGGYIVLNGLTPQGLADYNRLVGFGHMIRPFWREKVQLAAPRHPLAAGLTSGDVVMLSGERIFDWTSDIFVASDVFSYVVDLQDVAPFAAFPNDFAKLMVNGFRNADAWKYIVNLPQKDADWTLSLPRAQTLGALTWTPNQNYHYVTEFELTFDGKQTRKYTIPITDEPQDLAIVPPVTATQVRVRITRTSPNPSHQGDITGLDNLALWAARPPEFARAVRPLLNIGAIVEYPRGRGGIVLCNLLLKDTEAVPENVGKKRAILGTLLRNLKAPFSGGKTILAGGALAYTPLDLSKQANQYRDEKGWFGDAQYTFGALPTGKQTFAGVPFNVYHFTTSPVPTVVMVSGGGVPNNPPREVKGIPVGRKADALFFLHAARIDQRRNRDEVRDRKQFELARYTVTYADGQTVDVPVYSEVHVDNYRQAAPTPLPGAQIGWVRPYAPDGDSAVAYVMQWDNPRPDVDIRSVDVALGQEPRGVPVLLALTAAQAARPATAPRRP